MRLGCFLLGKQFYVLCNCYKFRFFFISFIKYDFIWMFFFFFLNVCGFKFEFQKVVKCIMFYCELQEVLNIDLIVKINIKFRFIIIFKYFFCIFIFVELIFVL